MKLLRTIALLGAAAGLVVAAEALAGGVRTGHTERTGAAATAVAAATFVDVSAISGGNTFGTQVALSDDARTAVVGEPRWSRPDPIGVSGAAWILERKAGSRGWSKRQLPVPRVRGGRLGTGVAISGDGRVVLVGAPSSSSVGGVGAAWLYMKAAGGNWVSQKLVPRDASADAGGSRFGFSVALSANGSTALVGGPGDASGKGAAWLFARSGGTWRQQGRKLTGGGGTGAGRFGHAVALAADGGTALVGAPFDDARRGAAWFFARTRAGWRQQGAKKTGQGEGGLQLGVDVAMAGNGRWAVVGAPGALRGFGAVWPFARLGTGWRRHAYVGAQPRAARFGRSVAIAARDGTTIIGSGDAQRKRGRVYALRCSASGCTRRGEELGGGLEVRETFGEDVDVSGEGEIALVGDPGRPPLGAGAARTFFTWPRVDRIRPFVGPIEGGSEVTITGVNFTKVQGVSFGSTPASRFTVESATQIRATSPAARAGAVHVRVTTALGRSDERRPGWYLADDNFVYVGPPVVTSITPASGPTEGGTRVRIAGRNLTYAETVRFGVVPVTSFGTTSIVAEVLELDVTTPPHSPGTVDVTVTTPGGTSAPSPAARFTYVGRGTTVSFDGLTTGGPGGAGALTVVRSQYAAQGVTFNGVSAIDYSKGPAAVIGFAHSGSVAVEQCVGVEFCTTPIRADFAAPQSLVRVWVGFSSRLNQALRVELRALDGGGSLVGTSEATFAASGGVIPIQTPLEVRASAAIIRAIEVSIPGGFTNALAMDDLTFEGG